MERNEAPALRRKRPATATPHSYRYRAHLRLYFALNEELRRQILRGARTRRLRNITIKLDPVQVQALRKIATQRSIPYQTLIREWLADGIRRELRLTGT